MINVPLPRLLDSSGQTAGYVRPIRESITLNMTPLSYATMELPVGESLPARSFVELNTAIGTAGVFRVRAPQEAYGEDVTLVELEHAIVEVGDWLILENLEGTFAAGTAMQRVFSHYRGTHWQLGSVSALTGNVELKAGYSRILDVMLDIVARCDGCMLTFDFSSHPWTVSVVRKGSAVAAEGRLSRNISSARISYDDTDLCTRAYYPIPSTNAETGEVTHTWGSVDADTIPTYGIAEKAVFDENDTTAAECLATAQKYLEKYKIPKFSIQITGEELATRTGESLDSFEVGKLFRLALADYNVTVEENITVLSWEDVYGSPTAVNITLAEEETDTASYIHDLDVSGSTVSSGSTKDVGGKVTTIYSSRTVNNEVDLVKIKADAAGNILAQAGMSIDPETGVLIYATDNVNNVGAMLQVQAGRITAEVERATSAESSVSGKLEVEAGKVAMVVGTKNGQNYIKAGEIALSINQSTGESEAKIDANHIYIGNEKSTTVINGKATIADLNTATARITSLEADAITTNNMSSKNLNVASLTSNRGGVSAYSGSFTTLNVGGDTASFKSTEVVTAVYRTLSATRAFAMEDGSTWYSAVVTQVTSDTATLHYLGSTPT